MADKEDYEVVEAVIRKLDIPRSMVYIESLIMEVNAVKSFDFGVQWQLFDQTNVNNQGVAYGGKFSSSPGVLNPLTALGTGLAVGVLTQPFTFGGIHALQRLGHHQCGQTGRQLQDPLHPPDPDDRQRGGPHHRGRKPPLPDPRHHRRVGRHLRVLRVPGRGQNPQDHPHVSEGRNVRLKLSLEVTNLDRVATAATTATRPVTQKRTIETTVLVQDNHTVVIGGLIDDNRNENETKVPGLGDIPLLGWLFKTQSDARQKTNLYVFITPRVVKSPEESDKLLSEKKPAVEPPPDMIKGGEIKLYPQDLN
jgi:general secretion pathway protein D